MAFDCLDNVRVCPRHSRVPCGGSVYIVNNDPHGGDLLTFDPFRAPRCCVTLAARHVTSSTADMPVSVCRLYLLLVVTGVDSTDTCRMDRRRV